LESILVRSFIWTWATANAEICELVQYFLDTEKDVMKCRVYFLDDCHFDYITKSLKETAGALVDHWIRGAGETMSSNMMSCNMVGKM
jgi:hypothetical protein